MLSHSETSISAKYLVVLLPPVKVITCYHGQRPKNKINWTIDRLFRKSNTFSFCSPALSSKLFLRTESFVSDFRYITVEKLVTAVWLEPTQNQALGAFATLFFNYKIKFTLPLNSHLGIQMHLSRASLHNSACCRPVGFFVLFCFVSFVETGFLLCSFRACLGTSSCRPGWP